VCAEKRSSHFLAESKPGKKRIIYLAKKLFRKGNTHIYSGDCEQSTARENSSAFQTNTPKTHQPASQPTSERERGKIRLVF
jgi:hypothetical protein